MLLYLIRHADAVSFQEDPNRPLSLRGVDEARRVAEFFAKNGGLKPAEVWHSPLQRARETAQHIASGTNFRGPVREIDGIIPEDDPNVIIQRLEKSRGLPAVAVVGHEPHLSSVATRLLYPNADKEIFFEIAKCSVLAFEGQSDSPKIPLRWTNLWHIATALLPVTEAGFKV